MKAVDRSKMLVYRARAEAAIAAMAILATELEVYGSAIVILAVHGAISLNDAVLIRYTGRRSSESDHRKASDFLNDLCNLRKSDKSGINHLRWLLSRKTDFAYGDKAIAITEMKAAVAHVERFQTWIYQTFPEVIREDNSVA